MATSLKMKNTLLPPFEQTQLVLEDGQNLQELEQCLGEIEAEQREIVDPRLLNNAVRLLNARRVLKYSPNAGALARAVNVFHDVVVNKRTSFPIKCRLLAEMQKLCGKAHGDTSRLNLKPIDWRAIWKDALDVAKRMKKDQSVASEQPIIAYMSGVVCFLHGARRYLVRDAAEADAIVQVRICVYPAPLPSSLSPTRIITHIVQVRPLIHPVVRRDSWSSCLGGVRIGSDVLHLKTTLHRTPSPNSNPHP